MLGQPYFMLVPDVVGMKLTGSLPAGTTATDLVLRVTQMLRAKGVVDKFVEYYGPGLSGLGLADRATIAQHVAGVWRHRRLLSRSTPRRCATCGAPAAARTRSTLVERYTKEQGLFRTDATPDPEFTSTIELDLATIEPSLAGTEAPAGHGAAANPAEEFRGQPPDADAANRAGSRAGSLPRPRPAAGPPRAAARPRRVAAPSGAAARSTARQHELSDGAVVIAAITSCTNTSNPSVMIGAGLLAKKAVARGLRSRPWVKTSLAPGSRVVTDYLRDAGLTPYLDQLGFQTVGYGCTTCIGNSGPLPEPVARAIEEHSLVVAAVLSGNRNFEARIHPLVRANYLASPMLVVAFALLGRVDADLTTEPLGISDAGEPVFLRDIWPTSTEIADAMAHRAHA